MNGKQTVFVTWFCVFLLLSCQFTNIDARKHTSSRKTGSSSSSAHVSRPSSDNKYSNSHADQAKLSYSGYNSAPNPPRTQPAAAAPAPPPPPLPPKPVEAAKPVGWNVPDGHAQQHTVHNTNAAPHQPQGAPPPYSANPVPAGPPPPYTPHNAPPAYQPAAAPPPAYQQPAAAPPPYSGGKFEKQ